jgi:hypothetical protein
MGRQWCRTTDPLVALGDQQYSVTVGVAGEARGNIDSAEVTIRSAEGQGEVRGHHRLLGIPLTFVFATDDIGDQPLAASLFIVGDADWPCTIEIREDNPAGRLILAGAGLAGEYVDALPIDEDN